MSSFLTDTQFCADQGKEQVYGGFKTAFPVIQDRKEVLTKIHDKTELLKMFHSWTEEQQEEFLDFYTEIKGPRMLYDAFFKEVMNPESAPERLNEFLSLILGTPVRIYAVLPNIYIHRSEQKSDTGIKIELLQKYVFIPIDIFKKTQHNKNITGKLNAWLMFFSAEEPEEIVRLIQAYPQFKPMYEEVYEMCRNTVQLMIDEMQEDLEQKKVELEKQNKELEKRSKELEKRNKEVEKQKAEIEQQKNVGERQKVEIEQQKNVAETERLRADRLEESERQKSEQLEQALRRIAELERQRG